MNLNREIIKLMFTDGVGNYRIRKFIEEYNCQIIETASQFSQKYKISSYNEQMVHDLSERLLDNMDSLRIGVVGFNDILFPERLKAILPPVNMLFSRGTFSVKSRMCGVTGKRIISNAEIALISSVAKNIAGRQVGIADGMALGTDAVFLQSYMRAGGEGAIGVLPCGCDVVYPQYNAFLFDKILYSGGMLISEYFIGSYPERYKFVMRDRIIAGLSDILLALGVENDSGTKITADFAASYGKRIINLKEGNLDKINGIFKNQSDF